MAEDPTAPSLNLTQEEKRVFGQLFRQADSENIGVVTGEVAVKFFEKTRLEPRILGEIWQIADKENRGLLTPAGFGIVLRLIGHYQAGRDPSPELALRPGPLPKFDGGSAPGMMSPTIQPPPGPPPSAIQPQASGPGPIRVPPLTPEKAGQYAALFEKSGAQNGILPGEQAKQIFERAGLPNDVLGRIWNLADTEQKGALQVTEFVIAMHLLASYKIGALRALPNLLPAGLYEAAARRPQSRQPSVPGAISAIPRQFSGAAAARTGSPLGRPGYSAPQQFPTPTASPMNGGDWAITPADKAKFDSIYTGLDRTNRGFITGEEAVPFFSDSKLPEEALASIWDLADINSAGRLTRDEFAVAMYLIRQQRGKRDGRDALPATLPPNLIPPSMRHQVRPEAHSTAPDFEEAQAPTIPKSAADDLFGLDALSSPPPMAPTQAPQSTGGSVSFPVSQSDPFGNSRSPMAASPTQNTPPSSIFKPFVPSSSFGMMTYQGTGNSNASAPSQARNLPMQSSSASDDLLGDNDPEISKKLNNETSELANLSNQAGSLSKQTQEVQGQRINTQNELTQATSQKKEFENRLAQLRTLYEQEVRDVRMLEEKLTASRNETKKLQTDIAMVEGSHQDLQVQHQQTAAALQADQQENASLKERMRAVNAEIAQMKPALEKLRSDARQQKGLVAINKKQLASSEAEKEKLKTEAEELNRSIEEDTKALAAAATTSKGFQSPSRVASPAGSTMSANNPFFRRQNSEAPTSPFAAVSSPFAAASPPVAQQADRTFENVFGPAFSTAGMNSEPPQTSFRQEKTVRSPSNSSEFSLPLRSQTAGGSVYPGASTSPPPTASRKLSSSSEQPPPPPESRQMNSSFLPFPSHEDSMTSSRQVSAPNSRSGEGSTADTPTNYMGMTPTGSSAAGPSETARAVSPELDRKSDTSPSTLEKQNSMPGAFPGTAASNIVPTPTGGSTLSEKATADPFAMKAPERVGTAKDDFDSAFASFGSTPKVQERSNTGNSTASGSAVVNTGFHKEFPPIAELDHDDESESGSDSGGFDDDFAPASPGHTRNVSSGTNDFLGAPRPTATSQASAMSLGGLPPTPGAQAPPPTYDKVVSPAEHAHTEAQQYAGLLPSRDIPSPSTISTAQAGAPTSFGSTVVTATPAPPAKISFDDDFDDFDGLEDAKEGDALDDDFGNSTADSVHERSGMDDFNPMFDSPPTSKGGEHDRSAPSQFGGSNGFGNFTASPTTTVPPSVSSNVNSNAPAAAVNDNHDWDAIFAGLDDGPSAGAKEATNGEGTGNGTALSSPTDRPQIGRALTEAGIHDDPILKNLVVMGYKRTDALAALEKYDYDLERAANFLASQS